MQKRGLMFAFTSIFLVAMINFVSAQFYGGFSLSDILSSIDSSTMILGIVFIVLKLTDVIDWSWWLIMLPFYGFYLAVFMFFGILLLLAKIIDLYYG